MRIGLTYNLKSDVPVVAGVEDWSAECEERATVELIAGALAHLGHTVIDLPYGRDLALRIAAAQPEIVFNIAEGWFGRNRESLVPAVLELLDVPYSGSDALTLGLALDKYLAKTVVAAAGLPVVASHLVSNPAQLAALSIDFPAFVKPNYEGSSKGIRGASRVNNREELAERVGWVLANYRQPALIEPFLSGREFSIGILGNDPPVALPVLEVVDAQSSVTSEQFVYSFETKSGNLERLLCPAPLEEEEKNRLTEIAVRAHTALGCRDFSRVDIRLDDKGEPFFLEINPLPGLSAQSLLTVQAKAAGLSYDRLIAAILGSACRRLGINVAEPCLIAHPA